MALRWRQHLLPATLPLVSHTRTLKVVRPNVQDFVNDCGSEARLPLKILAPMYDGWKHPTWQLHRVAEVVHTDPSRAIGTVVPEGLALVFAVPEQTSQGFALFDPALVFAVVLMVRVARIESDVERGPFCILVFLRLLMCPSFLFWSHFAVCSSITFVDGGLFFLLGSFDSYPNT